MWKFWQNVALVIVVIVLAVFFFFHLYGINWDTSPIKKIDNLLQGLIGALIFLVLVFYLIKPSLRVASVFAETPDDNCHLRFKVVNCSLYRAYDLNISIYHQQRINISGADIKSELLCEITSKDLAIPFLESGLKGIFDDAKRNAAQVRLNRFVANDKIIKDILTSDQSYIVVHVSVRHSLSGLQSNFSKRYDNITFVKKGFYEHGFGIDIK